MSLFFHIVLNGLLVFAFYQDWKFRAISWLVFPLLAIVAVLIFFQPGMQWKNIGLNLTFVAVVLLALFAYVSFKEIRFVNLFERHLGIGDLLFLIAVAPLFAHLNFILFFISGMFLSALAHLAINRWKNTSTIPLAGYLAIYIVLLKLCGWFFVMDLFTARIV